ncbi:Eco57I restriction-modification methylase domain-containing protein [candidate division WOR-3 bacterium]|nr:Eco57I restriction-modification methylase domain-containing protein [candidate division WOR-3 bacterium]
MGADSIHINKGLFSDHYLDKILPSPEEKRWSSDIDLGEAFDKIRKLYSEKETEVPNLNESQLEQFFIQPILDILGHHTIVQPSEKTSEGIKKPDYALFDSEDSRDEALRHINEDWGVFKTSVGLCEAKKWDRKLDVSLLDQPTLFESRNPAYQMQQYLYHSEVKWGILTNGRYWRLYEREQSKRLDRYYQVDLVELIGPEGSLFGKGMTRLDRLEAFKYFYLFFRRQAFPDFLDYVLAGSVDYAQAVGAELKDNVYKALRFLAQGFADYKGNELDSVKDKETIRENCFVLLYRLLFVLFAESKHLLPIADSPDYKQIYSLYHVREEVTHKLDHHLKYSKKTFTLWGKLNSLFTLINIGDETFRIPPYNGGLFDNDQHEFFEKYKVSDWVLAEVIYLLCIARANGKDKQSSRQEFIDYSSLEVRDLGSIYEGLLENRLEIAEEPMIAVRNGKREKWKSEADKHEKDNVTDRVDKGQYYPVFKRDERKATGSYYTPDYIVSYIVEHALGPLAEKCKTDKELLELKVLDPAIGSGHFLVEATDFLARQLLGKKKVEETEDEIGKAKRLVIERCIFGVDKNMLAVELAKLSLWLHTVARDKPLSFLDHHLRCGDSLIGAKVAELGTLPGEENQPLFTDMVARYSAKTIGFYKQIEDMPSDTLEQIHMKMGLLETARNQTLPFRKAADVWISTYFGNEVKPDDYSRVIDALGGGKEDALQQFEGEAWFDKADRLWDEHRFFHWELEFPEVFFDTKGRPLDNPGFDAVIGNPPYVRIQKLKKTAAADLDFYKQRYVAASEGNYDIYVVFVERGHSLLNKTSYFGYILPHKFFNSQYGVGLRSLLSKGKHLTHVVHFGFQQVFPEATTYTCLMFLRKKAVDKCRLVRVDDLEVWQTTREAYEEVIPATEITGSEWNFVAGNGRKLYAKLKRMPQKLGDVAHLFVGLQTSADDVFIMNLVDETTTTFRLYSKALDEEWLFKKGLIFPLVSGTDVSRYDPLPKRQYIIFPYKVIEKTVELIGFDTLSKNYPTLAAYLLKNKSRLENRENGKFRDKDWYRFGRSQNIGIQDKVKLCVPRLVESLLAAFDPDGKHFLDNVDVGGVTLKDEYSKQDLPYILGLLNSRLLRWFFPFVSAPFRGGWLSANRQFLSQLPIRTIDFSKPEDKKMHDDMVNMAQNMLDLHKRKQEIETDYTGWLEHLLETKIDELTGKSKIRNLEKLESANALADFVAKAKPRTRGLSETRGLNPLSKFDTREPRNYELLSKGFEKYKSKLTPIVDAIAETDRKIDQLVYRLYDLTEEEIQIVEGTE